MGRTLVSIAVCMFSLAAAAASDQPVIVNTGEATVLINPGTVEFKLIRHFSGDTMQDAMEQCTVFIEAAPQAIRGAELQPTELITSPPVIRSLAEKQVLTTVIVRFSMAVFNTAKTGPVQFAALCDKMTAIAETMKCTLAPPELLAADPENVMAAAVSHATENAYPPAEAVAVAVKTVIYAVDRVEVLSIEWEQQPEGYGAEVPQIGCKATVQVTYALAPQS